MKYSIKKQFSLISIGLIVGTVFLCWLINSTLLEKYYLQHKQDALLIAYKQMNEAAQQGKVLSEQFDIEMQRICNKYNIDVIIIDANANVIKSSISDEEVIKRNLLDSIFADNSDKKLLQETENYIIQDSYDGRTSTAYIEMWGVLDNGNMFLLRSAKAAIEDSVAIANRFLAYIGVIAVACSGILAWIVSRRVTEPILELTKISEQMIQLDFDAKYEGKSKTEIALLGDNINKLSETLEQTISELKTANNELEKDIARKNEIDEMRKEFLSNVSHELKTPIALIQGYAEGLKEGINDEENKDFYCDVIMDEAAKMNVMVKKLLTLNQLEFGNDPVTMERFNIVDLIQTYLHSADILLKQNDITIKFEQTMPIYVWADEFKTEEVFNNYFTNALHHCAAEKIIHIKLEQKEDKVRVSVFNTGMPLPEESIPHLWEKFYKVDKARTREYGGSGVGLSIVKAIMDSMNQAYGVNNYTNGVEFWFELATQ
ncbi:MAG: two-component sensor histidine kinase [Lachnospiraceae bacterium]|nr:two-component sensor histidine kinase [Lachnospiraceae bacterium]